MVMNTLPKSALDWVGDTRANVVAWWVPKCAIFVAMLAPAPVRAAVWISALIWMGAACFLNATSLRSHALPLHRAFLSCDDRASHSARYRHRFHQFPRLARTSSFYTAWRLDHLVGHRAGELRTLCANSSQIGWVSRLSQSCTAVPMLMRKALAKASGILLSGRGFWRRPTKPMLLRTFG